MKKIRINKITIYIWVVVFIMSLAGCSGEISHMADNRGFPALSDITDTNTRIWHYTDDTAGISDKTWTYADFDDTNWHTASGSFGAKDGGLNELSDGSIPKVCLRQYEPTGKTVPVYYFRLDFNADAKDVKMPLQAEITYDDAVIIYLNGKEILSCNTPKNGYPYPNSYGCNEAYGDPQKKEFTIDSSLLREGANVLAAELHQSDENSSDIYFAMDSLCAVDEETVASENAALQRDTVCLGVGGDDGEMLVTWQGPVCESPYIQVKCCNDDIEKTKTYAAQAVCSDNGVCTYRGVITDLTPGKYEYCVTDKAASESFSFDISKEGFSFLCGGDPQIAEAEDDAADIYQELAETIMGEDDPCFILSLGDQSDDGNDSELFCAFTRMPLLKSVPIAAVVGNHERNSEQFSRYFYMPNMDKATEGKSGDMSGDYWFYRRGALFLCLNSNNEDVSSHEGFMLDAVRSCEEKYGKPEWIVAALHFSLFSAGHHGEDENIIEGRALYPSVFKKVGVDVVFSGHDHSYTRSYPMNGNMPADNVNEGIVYFSLGSSTGSKFYDPIDEKPYYAAFCDDGKYPQMTRVDVTDRSMTVTVYQKTENETKLLDTYTINK